MCNSLQFVGCLVWALFQCLALMTLRALVFWILCLILFCVIGVETFTPEDAVPPIVDELDASSKHFGNLDPIAASAASWEIFPTCFAHYRWWEVVCFSVNEVKYFRCHWDL